MFEEPLLQWKSNNNYYYIFWVCVCCIRYPACNTHASYCHLWPVWLFSTLTHERHSGKKTLFNEKRVLRFSLQLQSEMFLILRRIERDMIKKYVFVFMLSTRYSCQILVKVVFWQIFENDSNTKFDGNPLSGSRVVPCGQTEWHDETSDCFSKFCELA